MPTADKRAVARFVLACMAAVLAALCAAGGARAAGAALDPAQAGIPVYPGARADAAASSFVRESLDMTGSAYRTADDVGKVASFYEKQKGFRKLPGATHEQAAFGAGCKTEANPHLKNGLHKCGYQVTVQRPWMDMKTGKLMPDTLLTIVKQ